MTVSTLMVKVDAKRVWYGRVLWPFVREALEIAGWLSGVSANRIYRIGSRYLTWTMRVRVGGGKWERLRPGALEDE